uniref:hypothetical protein n=1 Tax=Desulfosarcina cetonica TaxID=90730 RepID=UPI001C46F18A
MSTRLTPPCVATPWHPALFESLNTLAPDTARRWYRSTDQVRLNPQTTLLFCGLSPDMAELRGRVGKRLMDRLASDGGRIVITLGDRAQAQKKPEQDADGEENAAEDDDTPADPQTDADEAADAEKIWDAAENLGIRIALARRSGSPPVAHLLATRP